MVQSLGALVGWLARTYGIPLDYRVDENSPPLSRGFVAHGALQPVDRYDPGPWFPWEEVRAVATAHQNGGRIPTPRGIGLSEALLALATAAATWLMWRLTR